MKGYYFITDCRLSLAGNARDVEQALAAGVRVVQHRDKHADTAVMIEEARILRRICREALFLINDRVEVALAVEADGVHLGQEDLHYARGPPPAGRGQNHRHYGQYGGTGPGSRQSRSRLSGSLAHLRHPNQTRRR